MAKTISESISSIETSETSLESSLSKCKTSISNKGVSVPSTTRFSGLPALIDKIDTTSYPFSVYYTDKMHYGGGHLKVYLYSNDIEREYERLENNETRTFIVTKPDAYNEIRYCEDRSISGLLSINIDRVDLHPIYYFFVSDKIDNILQIMMTDSEKKENIRDLEKKDFFYHAQFFGTKVKFLRVYYRDNSNTLVTKYLKLHTFTYPHVHVVSLNIANSTYTEYIGTPNLLQALSVDTKIE